jgi:hypothetical protein
VAGAAFSTWRGRRFGSAVALQHFSVISSPSARLRTAGLRSIFSLPHLTRLDLSGPVSPSELFAFTAFASTPAPLVTLVLPMMKSELDDSGRGMAVVQEEAAAAGRALWRLLSRFTALRSHLPR